MCVLVLSRVWHFATSGTVDYQAPLTMEFSRQEYWNGLPFPTRGDLPDPGIKLYLLHLLNCQADSLALCCFRSFTPQGNVLFMHLSQENRQTKRSQRLSCLFILILGLILSVFNALSILGSQVLNSSEFLFNIYSMKSLNRFA